MTATAAPVITSRANPQFKALQRLLARAGKPGAPALLEGVHVCQAWCAQHGAPRAALFDAERLAHPELAALRANLPAHAVTLLAPQLLHALETVETSQGVLFVIEPPAPTLPAQITGNSVWLDSVQDPGNVGTILRSCAAAGLTQVLLGQGTAAAWSPKVLRSAQGAHFGLQIYERLDLPACLARLAVPLAVTTPDGGHDLYDAARDLPPACAWLFGHEGRGVAEPLARVADLRIRIVHSPAVESLNVGVAVALCLFEQRRRQRHP